MHWKMSTFKPGNSRETQIRINSKIHPSFLHWSTHFFLKLECSPRQLISSWILVLCSLWTEPCQLWFFFTWSSDPHKHASLGTQNLQSNQTVFCLYAQGASKLLLQVAVMTDYSPLFAYNALLFHHTPSKEKVFVSFISNFISVKSEMESFY